MIGVAQKSHFLTPRLVPLTLSSGPLGSPLTILNALCLHHGPLLGVPTELCVWQSEVSRGQCRLICFLLSPQLGEVNCEERPCPSTCAEPFAPPLLCCPGCQGNEVTGKPVVCILLWIFFEVCFCGFGSMKSHSKYFGNRTCQASLL